MQAEWPKRYRKLSQLMDAIARGDVPSKVISPGGAANVLGVTRQAVHDRLKRGSLRSWHAEGYILIDSRQVDAESRVKRGISQTQGELNVST